MLAEEIENAADEVAENEIGDGEESVPYPSIAAPRYKLGRSEGEGCPDTLATVP